MSAVWDSVLRNQIHERRHRLESAISVSGETPRLVSLLQEVDSVLERLDHGSYGLCEDCRGPLEADRLLADPTVRLCLACLTPEQQRALEADLDLAARIQAGLLPKAGRFDGWDVCFHYEPAGVVSGDYVDLVEDSSGLTFLLGDVSGKGVAASMLMAHLHAIFRSLAGLDLPVSRLVDQANRVFCESTLPTHFATLVCGRAAPSGAIEICNAGHCPPLVLRGGEITQVESTGLPIGIVCQAPYEVTSLCLDAGDTLVLHTDGLPEMENPLKAEYGMDRLRKVLGVNRARTGQDLLAACLGHARDFRSGAPLRDDLSLMVLRRG